MKKFNILLIALFIVSCGNNEDQKKPDELNQVAGGDSTIAIQEEAPEIEVAGGVYLHYNFEEGEAYNYKLTNFSSNSQYMKADTTIDNEILQNSNYFFTFKVLEVDEENISELKVTITAVSLTQSINKQSFTYDSGSNLTPDERKQYVEYESIVNNPFRVRLNQKGEIIEISRIEKILDKLLQIQEVKKELTSQERIQLIQNIKATAIQPITQQLFRILPDNKVVQGSTWQQITKTEVASFKIDNIVDFKLDAFRESDNGDVAEISASLKIKWTGENRVSEQGTTYNFEDPKISGNGNIRFNIEDGLLEKSETTTRSELVVNIEGKDKLGVTQKVKRRDTTVNSNIVTRL